ncbi:hypothetical protein TSUD_213010 [Trifolium subterraneum]|uniref:Uncharacterized protein n=1 Tax=Trifolium subterraneum TaxID=3900 RepID=A0A2Z6P2H2_TRISU|nr:hypothetical protein TSUD_213010 [Trifolium subterraneum]
MEGFFPHLSQGRPEVLFYAGKNRHRVGSLAVEIVEALSYLYRRHKNERGRGRKNLGRGRSSLVIDCQRGE